MTTNPVTTSTSELADRYIYDVNAAIEAGREDTAIALAQQAQQTHRVDASASARRATARSRRLARLWHRVDAYTLDVFNPQVPAKK